MDILESIHRFHAALEAAEDVPAALVTIHDDLEEICDAFKKLHVDVGVLIEKAKAVSEAK